MTAFSQMLSDCIADKDVSVQLLAQYCGMDRSYLYKIIRGKRTPSDINTVRKIAEYLHLTPKEENKLLENWEITELGADVYYRRRSVFEFLDEFPFEGETQNRNFEFSVVQKSNETPEDNIADFNRVLTGRNEIETHLLQQFLEASREDGRIQMLLPPDQRILHLFSYLHESVNIPVDHIFQFDRQDKPHNTTANYNLKCIRNILPLYTYSIEYHSYYYYGDPLGRGSLLSMFPYLVLVREEAILLSENLDSAMILKDRQSFLLLQDKFKGFMKDARPLVRRIAEPAALLGNSISHVLNQEEDGYTFQMLPCLTHLLTPELLEAHLTLAPYQKEELASMLNGYNSRLQTEYSSGRFVTMMSEEGVCYLLKHGRIAEYPDEIYTPLTAAECRELIQRIIDSKDENPVQYRMIRERVGSIFYGANIYVNQNSGYMLFRNPKNDQLVYLDILETSLLTAIYDYLDSMKEEQFYTPAEMRNRLRRIMADFRD